MWRNKQGFTLVEVLAVSLISVLVLAGIFSFYYFAQKIYGASSARAALHSNLRFASERITEKIRYADSLQLLDCWSKLPTGPSEVEPGTYYIYFDQDNNAIVILSSSNTTVITDRVISSVSFSVSGNSLRYEMEAEHRSHSYKLKSSVALLNAVPSPVDDPIPAIRLTLP